MKDTILFFAYSRWSNWRGHHDLVMEFSSNSKVIFVEVMRRYGKKGTRSIGDYLKSYLNPKVQILSSSLVIIPSLPMLPYALPLFSKIWRKKIVKLSIKLSKRLQSWHIKRVLRKLGWKPTIVMVCEALDLFHRGQFENSIFCYRTYDEIANFFSNIYIADVIEEIEKEKINAVDFVFTASRFQYEKRKPLHSEVFLVPNAGNFWHYNKAISDDLERPSDIKNISSPIIGFIGTFDFRMDLALIEAIAKSRPDWSLVIIGSVREYVFHEWKKSIDNIKSLSNTHFISQRDSKTLPAYMKYFDIGIIPFLVTPVTNTMYPYKLHEYLAAGLPVVSTDLNELKPFEGIVRLGRSKEEFVEMIEEELQTDSASRRKKRIEVARQNSWTVRAEQMLSLVNRKRDQKYANPTN